MGSDARGSLRYRPDHALRYDRLQCRIAGEVKGFDVAQYMPPKEARRLDTFIHYGVAASAEAIKDSGLEVSDANRERIGCVIGSGIGGLPMIENNHTELINRGPRRVSPFLIPGSISNMIAGTRVDPVRAARPESGNRHCVHHGSALNRRRGPHDRARRR